MKKIMALTVCMMLFGMANIASSYTYTSTEMIDKLLTTRMINTNTAEWSHTLGEGLVFDDLVVTSATLIINAFSANGPIRVNAAGEKIGELSGGVFQLNSPGENTFEIGRDILANLKGGKLDFSVTADDKFVYLWDYVLTFNYERCDPGGGHHNDNGGNAPVPEPGTLLLLGSGLSGLALWNRRRKNAA